MNFMNGFKTFFMCVCLYLLTKFNSGMNTIDKFGWSNEFGKPHILSQELDDVVRFYFILIH